ncbi:MAG TPA: AsmA-like C-terminal domain-containing protein, partial [Burkholderiales bacterium]|nr:AsmA-like C-terminal domain-containing protein [Burkholderiales bacterium]
GLLRALQVKTAAATFTADEVKASLRLWPLFRGRAEISSVEIARPVLRLTIVPAGAVPQEARLEEPSNPLQGYRTTMSAVVDALREFAPDTLLEVQNADVDVGVEGVPPIELRNVALSARTSSHGVEIQGSAASRYWNTMKLTGAIEYADLSSTAELHLNRINGQAWLDWLLRSAGIRADVPSADLSLRLRGDPAKALELDVDGTAPTVTLTREAQRFVVAPFVLKGKLVADAGEVAFQAANIAAGASNLSGGALRYAVKDGALDADVGYRLDLPQLADYARTLAPEAMARLESVTGALQGRTKLALRGADYRVSVSVDKSDAALQVKALPGPIRLARAAVDLDPKAVKVERAALSAPAGDVVVSSLRYAFKDGALAAAADFDLGLEKTLELVRAALPEDQRASLDIVQSAGGRLRGSAKGALAGKQWSGGVDIKQSDANVVVRGLPGPATLAGASVRATPKAVTVERVSVALLDAKATASAQISDFDKGPRIQGAAADATVGAKLLDWIWQSAQIAPNLQPKAPIRVAVRELAWAPKAPLDLRANAQFDSGPALGVDVTWSPAALEVRRATLKDAMSDLSVSLRARDGVYQGTYSGTLDSRSIAAMLKSAAAPAGAISGELAFTFDHADRRRNRAEGTLKAENLDLSWLAGKPAKLEHMDLRADGESLRIGDATLEWAGQRATLRGETRRGPNGPVVDAQIESPGIVVDALLPAKKEPAAKEAKPPAKEAKPASIWPLPLTGKIALRSQYVQYATYKVQPLSANVLLEEQRATLDVQEALICGFAVPLTLEATPAGLTARAEVAAQQQKVEQAAQCLTGEKVALSGTMNLRIDVRTQGKPAELVQNLKGTVGADIRDGQVMKFALIGNILSMKNVVAMLGQGGPDLTAAGFPFRQLAAKGRFDKGRFLLDEGLFRSNAIGLGANGWISLTDYQTSLTVLVAPLALLNEAVSKVPIIGYVAGGALTSLPVAVNGDIRDPLVVPLGPRAITSELKGILGRTLSLPGQLLPGEAKP